jgi:hypothetical protein
LDILQACFQTVLVPEEVAQEIRDFSAAIAEVQAIRDRRLFRALCAEMDAGEAAAITLACVQLAAAFGEQACLRRRVRNDRLWPTGRSCQGWRVRRKQASRRESDSKLIALHGKRPTRQAAVDRRDTIWCGLLEVPKIRPWIVAMMLDQTLPHGLDAVGWIKLQLIASCWCVGSGKWRIRGCFS